MIRFVWYVIDKYYFSDMSIYTVEEFRIGNVVKQGVINEIFLNDVYRIKVRGSSVEYTTVDIDYEPLTEEWLVKLGGIKHDSWWMASGLQIFQRDTGEFWFACDTFHGERTSELKYVHQLQNLYHALTGTEPM